MRSFRRGVAALAAVVVALTASACTATDQEPELAGVPSFRLTPGVWWHSKAGQSFQVQYSGRLDLSLKVEVYDLDGEGTTASDVAVLRARGVVPLCYLNAGAYENWRTDKDKFPKAVIGSAMKGWRGENWLDVTKVDILLPIMTARMDACAAKGFLGIDPDNTDGYTQKSGFKITKADQIAYQKALAVEAHKRGLAIGLKNTPDLLGQLAPDMDFAVNEECVRYRECGKYAGFLASGKAVFNIEYDGDLTKICPGRPDGMTTILKEDDLSAVRQAC